MQTEAHPLGPWARRNVHGWWLERPPVTGFFLCLQSDWVWWALQGHLDYSWEGLEPFHGLLQEHSSDREVCVPDTQVWCTGVHDSSWNPWYMVLVTEPKLNGAVVEFLGVMELFPGLYLGLWSVKSATWVQVFLKTALLDCGQHWVFTIFYLDLKALTKLLLSVDGCQIIVREGMWVRDILLGYLVDVWWLIFESEITKFG